MPPRPKAAAPAGEDAGSMLSPAQMQAIEHEQAQHEGGPGEEVDRNIDISWHAKVFVETMIVVNAIQLGICVNPDELPQLTTPCSVSEHVFICIFCIEFIYRIYLQRYGYFKVRWNQFDFVLTLTAVLDNWILNPLLQVSKSPVSNIYILRLVRLLRILRILKVLRTKKELQMLMEGLVGALKSMVWVAMLLGFLIYVSAIICVTLFAKVDSDYQLTFNSIPEAIFTLFSLAIVADWTEIVMPVITAYPWAAFGFVMFTIVATFGILNLIIGVITERTTMVQRSYEAVAQYRKDCARMKSIEEIAHIVFDTQDDGCITQQELENLMNGQDHGPMISTLIGSVQLPVGFTILDCHPMFDRDASGSINRDEFIQGMKRLIFSNPFQRSCCIQSAIADVLVEIKCVEERLGHLIDKEVRKLAGTSLSSAVAGGGGDGGTGEAEMTGGEAAEGDHTKPAEEKPAEAATADLRLQKELKAATADQLPNGGLSVPEAMRHHKELKVLSSKLLVRLREPMVQLLTEGLQAEVWADIASDIASDLARSSQHALRPARGHEVRSAWDHTHVDTGLFANEVPNDKRLENTASSAGSAGSKGNMQSASSQSRGPLPALEPRQPRETRAPDPRREKSRDSSSREGTQDFGAPVGSSSLTAGSLGVAKM